MKLRVLFYAIALLLTLGACHSDKSDKNDNSKASVSTVADDKVLPRPSEDRPVVDAAHLLHNATIDSIETLAARLNSYNGAQIEVVTVPSLNGLDTSEYAERLWKAWGGFGDKERNNGVLILVKPKTADESGQVRIHTGLGVENVLTNQLCQQIIDEEMIPRFKNNDYNGGVKAAVQRIEPLLRKAHPQIH